ncbi:MAG: Nitrilotriacetate monooxygenase component B [uncultured Acidimicrobiales bacterium]|uniref:Nitrilotriacetate monooxygenase component B n=1 Tax=uncultured Acidimicrobiales bacterium TaxID=310071 RepID=A0A6J4III3_9ACTN|nr:MAG: Nitrilotriacetate monooxygenase component B [uncultured Acidimicrobiales bacterium]
MPAFDAASFRTVLGHFCSGITIVTAVERGEPVGLTCQSFTSVSLDPPLVLFVPAKAASSWPRIRAAGHFCANVLAEDQEALGRRFAIRGADKYAGVGWRPGPSGAPVLDGCIAYVDCEIETVHEAGDHDIVVGHVVDLAVTSEAPPLLFFRGGYGRFAV